MGNVNESAASDAVDSRRKKVKSSNNLGPAFALFILCLLENLYQG